MLYFHYTPQIFSLIDRDVIWKISNSNREIYLTFDDGPTPIITQKTLEILDSFGVKATFFCLGQKILNNPELFLMIKDKGHAIGNHSFSHLKGWKTNNKAYFEDIEKAQELIQSKLFRPPYGKIKLSQIKELKKHYKIIMWDVIPGDFDPKISVETCVFQTLKHTQSGSIIVLHDSQKHGEKMLQVLPSILKGLLEKRFLFKTIS